MTMKSTFASPMLALTASLVAAPLIADDGTVVTGHREVYQERVSFNDLDLTRWGHQRALRNRVHKASERVCIDAEGPLDANVGFMGEASCTDKTYAHARPQIVAAIDRAKSGQQMALSLVVAVPKLAR